jgi:beta-glucosidase
MTTLTCDGSPSISVTTATNTGADTSVALTAASNADFVVVVAGLTAQDEGEEYTGAGDRLNLSLDGKQAAPYQGLQDKLINDVAALGKPMVVVLEGGSVIAMPWLSTVPSVVMAWYPGQRGGAALGKLLFGNVGGKSYNFSGKLPFTWGSSLDQYQIFDGKGTTPHYYYIGYHHFDNEGLTPLFAFGEGLSYTTFDYRKLQLGCSDMSKGAVLPVVVNVANTGNVAGDETVMVFVAFPNTTAQRRFPRELKGFARVHLDAGEEKQITIPVRLADLDYFQTDAPTDTARTGKWVVESGDIKIMVGGSSKSLTQVGTVTVHGY